MGRASYGVRLKCWQRQLPPHSTVRKPPVLRLTLGDADTLMLVKVYARLTPSVQEWRPSGRETTLAQVRDQTSALVVTYCHDHRAVEVFRGLTPGV